MLSLVIYKYKQSLYCLLHILTNKGFFMGRVSEGKESGGYCCPGNNSNLKFFNNTEDNVIASIVANC